MAILVLCPVCKKKQSNKNKYCNCGHDLDKAKRSKRIRYYIAYRLPNGKQKWEAAGTSVEDARAAEGKRKGQKRENRLFDIKPDAKMTFQELTDWYLNLEKVKAIKTFWRIETSLQHFNSYFGEMIVGNIKPIDIENYQVKRKKDGGVVKSTIDKELTAVRTMINKAFDNDVVGSDTLKAFKRVKNLLKKNANARDKILTMEQFNSLMSNLPLHMQAIVATAFYTGMRKGEILSLTWDKVNMDERVIRLEAEDTKDREPRTIPIGDALYKILKVIPRGLHDNHVFLYQGKRIKSDIRSALIHGCEKAGILYGQKVKGGFVFHDLRHSFNTHMRKAGVPESVIMQITGHSTREMFDRYNTIDSEDAKKAIEKLQEFFF